MEINPARRRGRPPKCQNVTAQPADPELEHLPDIPDLSKPLVQQVRRVYFHNGAYLGNFVKLSLDAEMNNVDLTLCSHGVKIWFKDTNRHFVAPIGMITGIELYPPHE